MIKYVYGICPAHVLYIYKMPKSWIAGYAKYFMVRINPEYNTDNGILEHELEHVRQWYVGVGVGVIAAILLSMFGFTVASLPALVVGASLHPILYKFVSGYKLFCEVAAYRIQNEQYPDDRSKLFAMFIATRYSLDISETEALQELNG